MDTIWATIPHIPTHEVSSEGECRRRSLRRGGPGRVCKGYKSPGGYVRVCLSVGNVTTTYLLHRLVLLSFEPKAEGDPRVQVNHKNGDKHDNRLANLEWMTVAENRRHAVRVIGVNFARGSGHPASKVTDEQVREIRLAKGAGEGLRLIARRYGISMGAVSMIASRKRWAHI